MDGIIDNYIKIEPEYITPYINHYGSGNPIGSGDKNGRGKAFVFVDIKDNYNGSDIISFNNHKVYMVNGYVLYITNVHNPWANAEIIKNDLTTQPCYIGKINEHIVVESSIKDALESLRKKIIKSSDNERDTAKAFVIAHPEYEKEYDWDEMVFWHSMINTSCADGRRIFTHNANMNSNSKATPKKLIEIMKTTSAKSLAIKMEELYLNKNNKIA